MNLLSMEKLKAKRKKEAERFKEISADLNIKRAFKTEKQNIKKDIRNIRAARFRSKLGFIKLKPDVPKIKKDTGTFIKTLGKVALGLADGVKMLGKETKNQKKKGQEQGEVRRGYDPFNSTDRKKEGR